MQPIRERRKWKFRGQNRISKIINLYTFRALKMQSLMLSTMDLHSSDHSMRGDTTIRRMLIQKPYMDP